MADHKSAIKRMKQTEVRTQRNRDRISRIKTFIKKFLSALGSAEAAEKFKTAQSEIQKGVTKGVFHKNTADRKVARLHKMLKTSEMK